MLDQVSLVLLNKLPHAFVGPLFRETELLRMVDCTVGVLFGIAGNSNGVHVFVMGLFESHNGPTVLAHLGTMKIEAPVE